MTPTFQLQLVRTAWAAALGALALTVATAASAVTINAPNLTDTAQIATCAGGAFERCKSEAYVSTTGLSADDFGIVESFDQWNDTQPMDQQWTLEYGGDLPGGEFTVTQFNAFASDPLGGMDIVIDWTYEGTEDDPKSGYLWTQGIFANYAFGNFNPPAEGEYALDTASLSGFPCNDMDSATNWLGGAPRNPDNHYCGPAYPFQTGDRQLGDSPRGYWPDSFFDAYSYVSKLDRVNRILYLFEGIQWGFQLSVAPEPGTWTMLIAGFAAIGALLRRRRAAMA